MSKSERNVVTKALQAINLIASDEEPTAQDYDDAVETYRVSHATLQAELRDNYQLRGASWGSDSVPDNIWTHVALCLAKDLTAVFPTPDARIQRVMIMAEMAKTSIITVLAGSKFRHRQYPDFPTSTRSVSTYQG